MVQSTNNLQAATFEVIFNQLNQQRDYELMLAIEKRGRQDLTMELTLKKIEIEELKSDRKDFEYKRKMLSDTICSLRNKNSRQMTWQH